MPVWFMGDRDQDPLINRGDAIIQDIQIISKYFESSNESNTSASRQLSVNPSTSPIANDQQSSLEPSTNPLTESPSMEPSVFPTYQACDEYTCNTTAAYADTETDNHVLGTINIIIMIVAVLLIAAAATCRTSIKCCFKVQSTEINNEVSDKLKIQVSNAVQIQLAKAVSVPDYSPTGQQAQGSTEILECLTPPKLERISHLISLPSISDIAELPIRPHRMSVDVDLIQFSDDDSKSNYLHPDSAKVTPSPSSKNVLKD